MPGSVRQKCLCKAKKLPKVRRKLEKELNYQRKKRVVKKPDKKGALTKLNWQLESHEGKMKSWKTSHHFTA